MSRLGRFYLSVLAGVVMVVVMVCAVAVVAYLHRQGTAPEGLEVEARAGVRGGEAGRDVTRTAAVVAGAEVGGAGSGGADSE